MIEGVFFEIIVTSAFHFHSQIKTSKLNNVKIKVLINYQNDKQVGSIIDDFHKLRFGSIYFHGSGEILYFK